jgi:alkylation response protein AidB-like acyl-CoA dehydrogenase
MLGSTYIEFDDVEVPVENLLGQENRGFEIIMSSKYLRSARPPDASGH